jgi:hypothetical protein
MKKQFILTKQKHLNEIQMNKTSIGNYLLFYQNDLTIVNLENKLIQIIAIGDLFDYQNSTLGNQEIIKSWLQKLETFEEILNASFRYSGEYIILYYHKISKSFKVFSDATAQYELLYSKNCDNEIILASNHSLVGLTKKLIPDNSPDAIEFFSSKAFLNRRSFVGSDTNFTNLKRLKPNHFIDINKGTMERYFPLEKKTETSLEEGVWKGAKMLKGYITAAANRYKLLIPVTAGWDSRLILAASMQVRNEAIYYVIYNKSNCPVYDKNIPKKLFRKLNMPFLIVEYDESLNNDIKEEVKQNILFPSQSIYQNTQNFFLHYPGHLKINGNISEIVRLEFDEIYNLNPQKIALIEKYPFLNYALKRYTNWYNTNISRFNKFGYRVLDMLYWEENCGNWVAKTKSQNRIMGINSFSPFNSRELILTLYGLPKKYRRKQNPVVYKKMIEILWPEVLQVPVNPGFKKIAMRITQYLGIFPIFRNLKLWWNLFKGRKRW